MINTNLILSCFAALFLIVSAIREEREKTLAEEDKKSRKFHILSLSIIIAFFSSAILIWTSIIAEQSSTKTENYQMVISRKSDSLLLLSQVLAGKSDSLNSLLNQSHWELENKSDTIIGVQSKNLQLSEKNSFLQNELYNQVTGGNSVPVVSSLQLFFSFSDPSRGLTFSIFNPGKYPINNINISYFHELEKKPTILSKNSGPWQITFSETEAPHDGGLTNLFLAAKRSHIILIDSLNYDTTDLLDVKWHINVSWRNVEYTCIIKDTPPLGLVRRRVLEQYYEYNSKIYKKGEIIAAIQKDLR